ncbi:MAG TPA: TPM domain-containing protein [Thermoanaerobaculia bacterium]|nr:TPM domain-containing protein [Thermoanaerobaculia bacterium]
MRALAHLLVLGAWLAGPAAAAAAPAVPPAPTRWVTDGAGFLSPSVRQELDARLEQYQARTGHQVLVWIAGSAGGEPIEDFAVRAFAAWRVGRKGIDDGLAIFIFAADRKIRFEVGYGLEDKVPDIIASRIIREVMTPRLQAGDRDGAVVAGVDATLAAISGTSGGEGAAAGAEQGARRGFEPGAVPRSARRPGRPLGLGQLILFGIIGLAFLILLITHPSFALFLLFNLLSGGRGGGGGGGGGGFSGGGGRSGGGGASGSW